MKFTLSWLKDHLDTDVPIGEIATKLSAIGLEVEEVANPAERLGGFVIARVIEAKQHPNADKLRVCRVDAGKGEVQVVCGAPNARTGMVGVFAPEGTYIPGTDFTLTKAKIRGVESNGMLCSERELELSDDHDGIIDLPADLASRLGERYVDVMGLTDAVIEVKVTPNRPDCLGVRGIARDLAAAGLGTLKKADEGWTKEGSFDCPIPIELHFPAGQSSACPAFAGRYVKGVKNGPSPQWLQQRLKAIGLRPISALVDITNYITHDRGRPLHVYDADKLKGAIHARLGRKGDTFLALDNKTYEADGEMTVIADSSGALGFGGIIGGESTGCTESTVNVLIESAYFDPVRTAMTGRRVGVQSDARYRFERGLDPESVPLGADLGAKMIVELCGGSVSRMTIAGKVPPSGRTIAFNTARVLGLSGLTLKDAEIRRILKALGFEIAGKGDTVTVTIPSWRPDVHGPADLVEEVVRIAGIDRVPSTPLPRLSGVSRATLTEGQKRVRRVRRLLASRGFIEAITWSFIPRDQAARFGGGSDALELANPIASDMSSMRPSLLPGLIAAAQRNIDRSLGDHALCEVGQAYRGDAETDQVMLASGLRVGTAGPSGAGRYWDSKAAPVDVFAAKADAAAVIASLGLDPARIQITRDAPAWFHPGRSGVFRLGPKTMLATFGELHPDVLKVLKADGPMVAFEVVLEAAPTAKKRATKAKAALDLSDLQPVRRDFAFLVDRKVAAGDVVRAAEGVDRKLITGVTVFDVFEGGSLGEGKKSLAIEVTLQPRERVLTAEEIDAVSQRIVAQVAKATGAAIRG